MSARPCHIALTGCPGVDSPITNISAEAPDPLLFWGVPWNPYNPYKPPPLGNGQYVIEDCPGWFTSLIAQFDPVVYAQTQLWANLQALALQLGCDFPQVGDLTFQNDAQTATVHCPDGSAFSYTVDAGTITATFADPELGAAWVLAANAWALAYAFEQASALLQCGVGDPDIPHIPGDNPPDFPRGPGILENPSWMCFGENYVDNYTITGGSIITNYTMSVIAGAIPPGTVFTQTGPRSANVSGVVTAPGQYTWTIQAVSTSIPTVTVTFQDSLWVMGISNASSLPDAETTIAYSEVLQGIGGTAPYTFALDAGSSMPDGLTLASDGTISGTPTVVDDFTFDVVVTDARGGECTVTVLLPVTGFSGCGAIPSNIADIVWTITGTNGTTITASMVGGTGALSSQFTQTSPNPPPYGTDDYTTHSILFTCLFCNPTALPIPITFTLPYVSTGSFYLPPAPGATCRITITIDGVPGVASPYSNFLTDTPNPLVATHSVPAMSTVTIVLAFFMTGLAAPPFSFLKVANTGPMTLT